MMLRADGVVRTGRAIDARGLVVDGERVAAAVRGEGGSVTVDAPEPGPVHERVGYVHPDLSLSVRTALAVAARSRGLSAPQDERIADLRAAVAAVDPPAPEADEAREQAATADAETDRLRERVATLRGRIEERRERDEETADLETALREAARRLSEAATSQAAATERLAGVSERRREARDARERRLRLEDELANREREARAHLVAELAAEYEVAVADAPGPTPADPFDADAVTAALAVARVAEVAAPVVLSCDRFRSPGRAAAWLDAPVVWL